MRIWVCDECGKTVTCHDVDYCVPNTICKCQFPDHLVQMVEVKNELKKEIK
jgi:hypothetical protein